MLTSLPKVNFLNCTKVGKRTERWRLFGVRAHDNRSKDVAPIQSTFSATLSAIRQSFLLELSKWWRRQRTPNPVSFWQLMPFEETENSVNCFDRIFFFGQVLFFVSRQVWTWDETDSGKSHVSPFFNRIDRLLLSPSRAEPTSDELNGRRRPHFVKSWVLNLPPLFYRMKHTFL